MSIEWTRIYDMLTIRDDQIEHLNKGSRYLVNHMNNIELYSMYSQMLDDGYSGYSFQIVADEMKERGLLHEEQ